MSSLENYKGLDIITPDPTGTGGSWLNENMKSIADSIEASDSDILDNINNIKNLMMVTIPGNIYNDNYIVVPFGSVTNVEPAGVLASSWEAELSDGDRTSLITVSHNISGTVANTAPQKAVDGVIHNSNAAFPGGTPINSPVVYDFGTNPIIMDKINFIVFGSSNQISAWKVDGSDDFVWQGSNDGNSWTTITNIGVDNCVDSEALIGNYRHVIFDITDKTNSYRYFRITTLTTGRYPPRDYNNYDGFWLYDTRFKYFVTPYTTSTNSLGNYLTSVDTDQVFAFQTLTKSISSIPSSIVVNLVKESDTATMNTDIVVSVSRDGGTTYTSGTMIYTKDFAGLEFYTDTIDVSGQPSGTDIKVKVESKNVTGDHEIKMHGLSISWS